jgi:hypothetical protein
MVAQAVAVAIAIAFAISVVVANSVAVTVAVAHRCHRCHWPLLNHHAAISVMLPSAIAVAVTLAVGRCRLHHRWPSPLPSPSAISESCCLCAARIVFKKLKQKWLTLFYFVQTVGGTLIKAR